MCAYLFTYMHAFILLSYVYNNLLAPDQALVNKYKLSQKRIFDSANFYLCILILNVVQVF